MHIKCIPVGHLETNCYIVSNEYTRECVVIDPGDESNTIMDYLEDNHLICKSIFITHGHFDHVGAVDSIADQTGATVYMNKPDDNRIRCSEHFPYSLPDDGTYYTGGDTISTAGLDFEIISTPGHTPGGVSILCEDALFTGDTLFKGSMGRTDLDGGNPEDIMKSLKLLCSLDETLEVYPGHMDQTTLFKEKLLNYYCRAAMSL